MLEYEYEELRIRIWKIGTARYLVFANGPEAAAEIITPEKSPEYYLEAFDALLQEEFGRLPRGKDPVRQRLQALGQDIFNTFLPTAIRACLIKSHAAVVGRKRALRIRLDVAPELSDIPFEILYSPLLDLPGFLALQPKVSIVRSLAGASREPLRVPAPAESCKGFSLLIVVPSPKGKEQLDVDQELNQLVSALNTFGGIHLQYLGGPLDDLSQEVTRRNLLNCVTALGKKPCAVLVIAHGEYDQERKASGVLLEGEDGSPDWVPGDILAGLLARASGLRFVALNLCLGTKSAPFDPFSGLAQALIKNGIPAVVGMQFEVSDKAAIVFSPALFSALCENQWVDEAVARGRISMAPTKEETTIEWGTPVLFLHHQYGHGWLFKVSEDDDELD